MYVWDVFLWFFFVLTDAGFWSPLVPLVPLPQAPQAKPANAAKMDVDDCPELVLADGGQVCRSWMQWLGMRCFLEVVFFSCLEIACFIIPHKSSVHILVFNSDSEVCQNIQRSRHSRGYYLGELFLCLLIIILHCLEQVEDYGKASFKFPQGG